MNIFANFISSYYVSILFIILFGPGNSHYLSARYKNSSFYAFFKYKLTFCPRDYHWPKTHAMLEQVCAHHFPILCAVTCHWKLEINNSVVFASQTVANARNQNLFPLGNWLLNISFYPLPTTEIHRNLFAHFRCTQSACEIGGSSFTDKWVYIYPCTLHGDGSKVWCCKEQYCIGTWNNRSMNQGKVKVVKQEMARVNADILRISKLKWTGMGKFNSDDHYIYQ